MDNKLKESFLIVRDSNLRIEFKNSVFYFILLILGSVLNGFKAEFSLVSWYCYCSRHTQ